MGVLVTGATGFLGSHMAVALKDHGVVATGRDQDKLRTLASLGLRTIALDLGFPVPAADRDRIGRIDAVVHCAGLSSPWGREADFVHANETATGNVLELAAQLGAKRFVLISTASVYFQFKDQDDLKEGDVAGHFVNAYAKTKFAAEQAVLARCDLSPVVIRPRGIYGAGDTTLLPRLTRVASRGLPRFSQDGVTDITHVDDVVSACMAALAMEHVTKGEVFNVSGGVGMSLPDIITAACDATGIRPRWRELPFGPACAAVRTMESICRLLPGYPEPPVTAYALGIMRYRQTMNIDHARRKLGWAPQVDFEQGLARSFADGAMRKGIL